MNGAKKTLVAKMLSRHGMKFYTLSKTLSVELESRGLPQSPVEFARLAKKLRARYGDDILARRTIEDIEGSSPIIIDGIRSPAEVDYFKRKARKFILILVYASPETRFQRFRRRRHPFLSTREKFEEQERSNLNLGIGQVISKADYVIVNERYFPSSLRSQVNRLYQFLVRSFPQSMSKGGISD